MDTAPAPSCPRQSLVCADLEGLDSLSELALDMRSAWNHATDEVWRQLEPVLRESTHNPWVESMAQLSARLSTNRSVRDYTEQHDLPAAVAYQACSVDKGALGEQVVYWHRRLEQQWTSLRFGEVRVDSNAEHHRIEVELFLGDLDPSAVRVELYADALAGGGLVRQEMTRWQRQSDPTGPWCYRTAIPGTRPLSDDTARAIAQHSAVPVPLECTRILWQR